MGTSSLLTQTEHIHILSSIQITIIYVPINKQQATSPRDFFASGIHTYIHTYIHTTGHSPTGFLHLGHTYTHTYIHTRIYTYYNRSQSRGISSSLAHIHPHIHTHIHTYNRSQSRGITSSGAHIHPYIHTSIHTHIHTTGHSPTGFLHLGPGNRARRPGARVLRARKLLQTSVGMAGQAKVVRFFGICCDCGFVYFSDFGGTE